MAQTGRAPRMGCAALEGFTKYFREVENSIHIYIVAKPSHSVKKRLKIKPFQIAISIY